MPDQIRATCSVSDERLITTEGTIIPQAVRFANGNMIVRYSLGCDAYFTARGAHRSADNGKTWVKCTPPLPTASETFGVIGPGRALTFDSHLWQIGPDEYATFYSETHDSGDSFEAPKLARFHIENLIAKPYVPRAHDDPDYFYEPEVPEFYDPIIKEHGAAIGGHIFGPIIRLPDGALGMSAYCLVEGNMRRKERDPSTYVAMRPAEGIAEEATDDMLFSSVFLRSEDDGETWHSPSTILKATADFPFDAGVLYSEGFTETGLSCTSDGKIYALMRHGSYMLLWGVISSDGGRTWGEPLCFNYPGVAPNLCLMPNGILAAAWGRPGMSVGFSLDGTGRTWDALVGVMQDDEQSQMYPWIVPIADDRLMLFYDRRKWDADKRVHYDHGIYCRDITLDRG
jgi:hypothetical protein